MFKLTLLMIYNPKNVTIASFSQEDNDQNGFS